MESIATFSDSRREQLKQEFAKALETANQIFATQAFRKISESRAKYNGALFETWTVHLSQLTDEERTLLVLNKAQVIDAFKSLLTENTIFYDSISKGNSQFKAIETRFIEIETLIRNILNNPARRAKIFPCSHSRL